MFHGILLTKLNGYIDYWGHNAGSTPQGLNTEHLYQEVPVQHEEYRGL